VKGKANVYREFHKTLMEKSAVLQEGKKKKK